MLSSNFRQQSRPSRKHNFQLVKNRPADGVRGKQFIQLVLFQNQHTMERSPDESGRRSKRKLVQEPTLIQIRTVGPCRLDRFSLSIFLQSHLVGSGKRKNDLSISSNQIDIFQREKIIDDRGTNNYQ